MDLTTIRRSEYTGAQVLEVLKILHPDKTKLNYQHLSYYKKRPFLHTTGKRRGFDYRSDLYTLTDLILLCFHFNMKRHGMHADHLEHVAHYIRAGFNGQHHVDRLFQMYGSDVVLAGNAERAVFITINGTEPDVLPQTSFIWYYKFSDMVKELLQVLDSQFVLDDRIAVQN